MALSDYIFPLLVFSAVMAGLSIFVLDYGETQGKDLDDVSTNLNTIRDFQTQIEAIKDGITNTQITGISVIDIPFAVITTLFNVIKLMTIGILNIWFGVLNEISTIIGLPGWFTAFITTALMGMIIFEFVGWAHKRRT